MLYYLVRPLARIALRIFLRRISISHAERVPVGKPVILAVNHPTAFMEPCILACFLGRPLYFLVRGDVFSTPLVSAILRMLHMLPMYRLKDRGYQFVKENFQTLDVCFDALSTNKTIMILAEGTTIAEKRLRPLKKGAARLAFGALDKYPKLEDVWVVPVGVNFDYMDRFRAGVMIDIGQPLSTRAYYGQFQANSQTGIEVFNETLRKRMEALMVLIPRVEDEWLTEQVLHTFRSGRPMSCQWQIERTNEWLLQEKRLAAHVGHLSEQEKNELSSQCSTYLEQLKALKVNDRSVVKDSPVSLEAPFIYVLALPLMLTGYLMNLVPGATAKWITQKTVSDIEFYAPVMLTVAMALYILYYIMLSGISVQLAGINAPVLILLTGLSGIGAVCYREKISDMMSDWHWHKLNEETRVKVKALRTPLKQHHDTAKEQAG
jgi:glycerol-3-phosphate O-acyltransferase / dihydroxyacetone phosphate acyltransferase